MTEEQKALFKEMQPRIQEGYRLLEMDRYRRIRETDPIQGVLQLWPGFVEAARLPARKSSGLVEFYKALSRTKE